MRSLMPPRTNDFQRLVYLVRVNLADGATVTESKMLTDRLTKRKREVDVCVEGVVGGTPVLVAIECRDHKRIADVSWVDAMKAKHDRLPTNALVLASRRGFTPEARDVATRYGIRTFALTDVESVDFPALFGVTSSLWVKSVTIPGPERVSVTLAGHSAFGPETVEAAPDTLVYSSDGKDSLQMVVLARMVINAPTVVDRLLSEGKESNRGFEMTWEPVLDHAGNPLCLRKIEPEALREIKSIHITAQCQFQIAQFGMRGGKLGDVHVAWGKTDILGRSAHVVATKDSAGVAKVSVDIAKTRK